MNSQVLTSNARNQEIKNNWLTSKSSREDGDGKSDNEGKGLVTSLLIGWPAFSSCHSRQMALYV